MLLRTASEVEMAAMRRHDGDGRMERCVLGILGSCISSDNNVKSH